MLLFIFRLAIAIFAVILIVFGLAVMIAPTPFGFILVILGILLFATAAPELFRKLRKRWKWLDRRLDAFQRRAPRWLAKRLKLSDPETDEDDEQDENNNNGANENSGKKRKNNKERRR